MVPDSITEGEEVFVGSVEFVMVRQTSTVPEGRVQDQAEIDRTYVVRHRAE